MPIADTSALQDSDRLAALDSYGVLDTAPEPAFDDIVELAKIICETPVALISLVAGERQWFKARSGFEPCETSIDQSVCAHAVAERTTLVIPDLSVDPRTADNPLVTGDPKIRFYAGVPLETPAGHILGTLCVIDAKPRPEGLSEAQLAGLSALARQVVAQLELRRLMEERQTQDRYYRMLFDAIDVGFCVVRMVFDENGNAADYQFLDVNAAFERQTGIADAAGRWMRQIAPDHEQFWFDTYGRVALTGEPVRFESKADALARVFEVYAFPIGEIEQDRVGIIFTDVSERALSHAAAVAARERLDLALGAGDGIGTWDWDVQRNIVTSDERFAELYGIDPVTARKGLPINDFLKHVHPGDLPGLDAAIGEAMATGGTFAAEYRLLGPNGVIWVSAQGRCTLAADGTPLHFPGVSFETTRRKLAEQRQAALLSLGETLRQVTDRPLAIAAATRVLVETLSVSRAGYAIIDMRAGTMILDTWSGDGAAALAGVYSLAPFSATFDQLARGETVLVSNAASAAWLDGDADGYASMAVEAQISVPLLASGELVAAVFVHSDRPRAWLPEEVDFVHAVADRTFAALAHLSAVEEQQVLNNELSHRMKNTFSMVQAIASQTLKGVSERQAVDAFTKRLLALSRAHDVLLQQNWVSARVYPIIENVVSLHAESARYRLSGPNINLGPKAVLSMSLVLHELATNALKYGALSLRGGHVEIGWTVDIGQDRFTLVWKEVGGPNVAAPTRKGFGSRLIALGLLGGGGTTQHYEPAGLVVEFEAPLSLVTRS